MINHAIKGDSTAFAGYYESPRMGLLALLSPRDAQRVLEIGCGGGANLGEVKKRFPSCHTTGVELRADAANAARTSGRADALLQGDVLDPSQVSFPPARFDLIICSHVLEHFAQPDLLLARVRQWLAPGGQVLVALPNVRHVSVLVGLLWRGDFRYQASGILDHTHLRFYTRKSAARFLTDCGWRIEACCADIDGPKSRRLSQLSLGWADDFAAFAYNFSLRAA
jgi:2-polyprenyl-3-methyl-5-hydroxy-6-metoxy-1,4-benzoquinol methylase